MVRSGATSGDLRYASFLDDLEKDINKIDWTLATDSEIKHINALIKKADKTPIRNIGPKCKLEQILDLMGSKWPQIKTSKRIAELIHKYSIAVALNYILCDPTEHGTIDTYSFLDAQAVYWISYAAALRKKFNLYSNHEQKQE